MATIHDGNKTEMSRNEIPFTSLSFYLYNHLDHHLSSFFLEIASTKTKATAVVDWFILCFLSTFFEQNISISEKNVLSELSLSYRWLLPIISACHVDINESNVFVYLFVYSSINDNINLRLVRQEEQEQGNESTKFSFSYCCLKIKYIIAHVCHQKSIFLFVLKTSKCGGHMWAFENKRFFKGFCFYINTINLSIT